MNFSHNSRGGPAGFGGFGFDPEQIFGPQGLLNQVFGTATGQSDWARSGPGRRGPGSGGGPFASEGPFGPDGPFGQFGQPGHADGRRQGGRRARRGDVRNAILHLLLREPMNGYRIMQEIEQGSGGAWRPSSGAVYPALAQLEDEGLVKHVRVEDRKAYQLTQAGQDEAQQLPPQTWVTAAEPDDAWAAGSGHRAGRDRHRHRGGTGGPGERGRRERGAQLWKALGSVAMATQAVGQAGDQQLSREAADLLDRTRRDLYRLLAEAEYSRDEDEQADAEERAEEGEGVEEASEDDARTAATDGEITDAEIVED